MFFDVLRTIHYIEQFHSVLLLVQLLIEGMNTLKKRAVAVVNHKCGSSLMDLPNIMPNQEQSSLWPCINVAKNFRNPKHWLYLGAMMYALQCFIQTYVCTTRGVGLTRRKAKLTLGGGLKRTYVHSEQISRKGTQDPGGGGANGSSRPPK